MITTDKIKNFLFAHSLMIKEKIVGLPDYQKEQITHRSNVCQDCLIAGKCPHCGCPTPDKFFQFQPCEGKRWPALMDEKDWE